MIRILALLALYGAAQAQEVVYVPPHCRSDGVCVQGHYRTVPNSSRQDNFSTQGNVNPYTAQPGSEPAYPYQYRYRRR